MFRFLILTAATILGLHGQIPAFAREDKVDMLDSYYRASSFDESEMVCARENNNAVKPPCYFEGNYIPNACPSRIFLFEADYLYWQTRSDELPYAVINATTGASPDLVLTSGKFYRLQPEYNSGVRLGGKVFIPALRNLLFSGKWTYYQTTGNGNTPTLLASEYMYPTWMNPNQNPLPALAEGEYSLQTNIADFSIERIFFPSSKLKINSLIGVRALWLDQGLNVLYSGGSLADPVLSKNTANLSGTGLRTGVSTQWNLCYGLSVLGWSYIDLIWSKTTINQRNEYQADIRAATQDIIFTTNPMFELFLGLCWEKIVASKNMSRGTNVSARIGWEQQYLINGVQFNQYTEFRSTDAISAIVHQTGGLSFGGLTAGLSIGF